jgi:hypothetical protein
VQAHLRARNPKVTSARIAPLALSRGKAIALTGARGPVWIRGNVETLFQAIRNLAENAITHTPEGTSVEIDVADQPSVRTRMGFRPPVRAIPGVVDEGNRWIATANSGRKNRGYACDAIRIVRSPRAQVGSLMRQTVNGFFSHSR